MTNTRGSNNPNWRGGRSIASNGYVLIRLPEHRLADTRGYVYEHRLVAETALGRPLDKYEIVHHLNGNKLDNRPDNLKVVASVAEHRNLHRKRTSDRMLANQSNQVATCACGCGSTFPMYDSNGRPRRFVTGHNTQVRNPIIECACGCGARFKRFNTKGNSREYVYSHRPKRENPIITCACGCGGTMNRFDANWRPRRFIHSHTNSKR